MRVSQKFNKATKSLVDKLKQYTQDIFEFIDEDIIFYGYKKFFVNTFSLDMIFSLYDDMERSSKLLSSSWIISPSLRGVKITFKSLSRLVLNEMFLSKSQVEEFKNLSPLTYLDISCCGWFGSLKLNDVKTDRLNICIDISNSGRRIYLPFSIKFLDLALCKKKSSYELHQNSLEIMILSRTRLESL
jgi:hypothetical protein